jgi:hypothetical protein
MKRNNSIFFFRGIFFLLIICIALSCRNEVIYKTAWESFMGEEIVYHVKGDLVSLEYRTEYGVYFYNDSIVSNQIGTERYQLKSNYKFAEGRFKLNKYDSLSPLLKNSIVVKENLFTTQAASIEVYCDAKKLERIGPRQFRIPAEFSDSMVNCEIVFENSRFKYSLGEIALDAPVIEVSMNVVNPYGGYLVPFTETYLINYGDSIKLEIDGEEKVLYKNKRR